MTIAMDFSDLPFQSAPGFLAGRNVKSSICPFVPGLFQSAPGFLAGRNSMSVRLPPRLTGFNPLPAFWPGET